MTAEDGKDGHKYEWQSWPPDSLEGMPPKRRRLVAWGLLWFLLVGWLFGEVLEAVGMPQPWRSLLMVAGLVAVFGPLIRGASQETRQLRAEGIDLPSYPVSRKSLVTNAVITGVAWVGFAVFAAAGQPPAVVLPVACTGWLFYLFWRWRASRT
ncbi:MULTISPECIES: hypothetical protein [Terrabacteria group]|uniref:hypothetical protein n=1 Tax=Bacillati TaxID=1783272 RepID=UPI003642B761